MRPEPADQNEMVSRAREVVHVLERNVLESNAGAKVDWDRFRSIATGYNGSPFAAQFSTSSRTRRRPLRRMVSWSN
jgi:hypothetical protein